MLEYSNNRYTPQEAVKAVTTFMAVAWIGLDASQHTTLNALFHTAPVTVGFSMPKCKDLLGTRFTRAWAPLCEFWRRISQKSTTYACCWFLCCVICFTILSTMSTYALQKLWMMHWWELSSLLKTLHDTQLHELRWSINSREHLAKMYKFPNK